MDLRRLRAGEWIVGAAGVALFVSLFLDWYQVKGAPSGLSAWDAFDVIDVVLCVIAISAIALAIVTAFQRTPAIPIAMATIVTFLALLAVGLVVYRVLDKPDVAVLALGANVFKVSRSVGLWVALGSSVAMLAGCFLAIRDESPGAPAPPVEAEELPAPAP